MQFFHISWVKPDYFKIFRGISPQVTFLVVIFLTEFSIPLKVTGLKENFSIIKKLLLIFFLIIGEFLDLLTIAFSWSSALSF